VFERLGLGHDANAMANYAILTDADNGVLADEVPKTAYERLGPEQKRWASHQFIPVRELELLDASAFDAFARRRAKEMAGALNEFLGFRSGRVGTNLKVFPRPQEYSRRLGVVLK